MATLAPSVLAANWLNLKQELDSCAACGITRIHFDVMDGQFVPPISFGDKFIRDARAAFPQFFFDAHLMVKDSARHAQTCMEAGADAVTVHLEENPFFFRTAQALRAGGCRVGIAINPQTPASALEAVLPHADIVLVMSVDPGFGGQHFIEASLTKAKAIDAMRRAGGYSFEISMDGGLYAHNAQQAVDAGVDVLVMGTGFFGQSDRAAVAKQVQLLRRSLHGPK